MNHKFSHLNEKTVGVIFAGDDELAPFLIELHNCNYTVIPKAILKFYLGEIEGIRIVTLFSGDKIRQDYSPLCVDMETGAIAHICYVNDIPYLSIRTITDTPENKGIKEFELNCNRASQKSSAIVKALLKVIYIG